MNTPGDTTQRPDGHTGDPRKPGLGWRSLAVFAGILIASPVAGLRPMRALRFTSTSFPRPGNVNEFFAPL